MECLLGVTDPFIHSLAHFFTSFCLSTCLFTSFITFLLNHCKQIVVNSILYKTAVRDMLVLSIWQRSLLLFTEVLKQMEFLIY